MSKQLKIEKVFYIENGEIRFCIDEDDNSIIVKHYILPMRDEKTNSIFCEQKTFEDYSYSDYDVYYLIDLYKLNALNI